MENLDREAFRAGMERGLPLVFSAAFFGLVFGFTGAAGEVPLLWTSAMSYIIFAGSAQFITLVLVIQNQTMVAILIAATILNLRHLLYGGVLHDLLTFKGAKKLFPAYFMTDESFLVTTLVNKERPDYRSDFVLLGAGITLWSCWNVATILGYLIHQLAADLITLPDNFVIAASFVGFLTEHWVKFPKDRPIIVICTAISLILGWVTSSSILLIVVMTSGALYGMWQGRNANV